MRMGYGDDDDPSSVDLVHDAEWIATKQVSSSVMIKRWPNLWLFRDRQLSRIEFGIEAERRGGTPLGVPPCTRLGVLESLGEVLKISRHPGQPV